MTASLLEELRSYVRFDGADEQALRALHPLAAPEIPRLAELFYARILEHEGARKALPGGERMVGQLKLTLSQWMDELLLGPWDAAYFERRCRIGRIHVRIALPQHYVFGAMDVIRSGLIAIIDRHYQAAEARQAAVSAVNKILDIELGIMLDAYREDLLERQGRRFQEKLAAIRTLTAGLSHEIRNPLNAAKLQLEVLERMLRRRLPAGLQDELLEPLTLVRDEIRRLDHLLEDFLQFARPARFVAAPVGTKSLVDKVLDLLTGDAERRGVRITRDVQTDAAISGDEERLRQVLMNLALNALEAVGPEGTIRVSAEATDAEVILKVEDNGSGVPAELQERIFEPFFTTKAAGSGLGLPILQAIVMQHGGSVSLEDVEGGGARFVVRLPRAE